MSGDPRAGIVTFFLQNKKRFSYFHNEVAEIRGENWNWGEGRGGGALEKLEGLPPAFLRFFLQNLKKSFMQNEVAEIRGEG